jgi:hypothetical protein
MVGIAMNRDQRLIDLNEPRSLLVERTAADAAYMMMPLPP